jgi:hypothetical protein
LLGGGVKSAFLVEAWTPDQIAAIAWLRNFYSQVFASTGGVPDPANPAYQGCCINNYPRLQAVKAKWDPNNIFQHPVSITAP